MSVHDEVLNENEDLTIYHPNNMWQYKTFKANEYYLEPLLQPIFIKGHLVYDVPTIDEIRKYREQQFNRLWPQYQRFEYPQIYKVSLTKSLLEIKAKLINQLKENNK